jgi:hypothetical protein
MNTPQKYTKRPVTIEAMQWDGTAAGATPIINWAMDHGVTIAYWCDGGFACQSLIGAHKLRIPTLEGDMFATAADFIIKGVQDEFYRCKPDIFAATYDIAVEENNE